jgi:hypothetical protein
MSRPRLFKSPDVIFVSQAQARRTGKPLLFPPPSALVFQRYLQSAYHSSACRGTPYVCNSLKFPFVTNGIGHADRNLER